MLTVHLSLKQEVQVYMDTSMNLALMRDITAQKVKVKGERGAVIEIKLRTSVRCYTEFQPHKLIIHLQQDSMTVC